MLFTKSEPALALRGIHLDLKGLPPTPARLLELLELLAECRINCVLVEWEDTFPWRDPSLRCASAYDHALVATFMTRAQDLGIEVIPLVQTFGHLQNVLVHQHYAHLREVSDGCEDLCPSLPESRELIAGMIEEIISSHPGITRIHLGGDEVASLGRCERCAQQVRERGKEGLYLAHITPLLEQVAAQGLRPILWDDMMRGWSQPALRQIGASADLMAWSYTPAVFDFLSRDQLDAFAAAAVPLWAASGFKGADDATGDHPALMKRSANLGIWAHEAVERSMVGAVATGWSRYTTMLSPCESLETSLDSLVLAAASMWDGSLAADAPAEAETMLCTGRLAAWAGERFRACREAGRQLARWRGNEWPLDHFLSHAAVVGEAERLDPAALARASTGLREHLARGEQLAADWVAAHYDLVPELWLERYAQSRLWFARRVLQPMLQSAGVGPMEALDQALA